MKKMLIAVASTAILIGALSGCTTQNDAAQNDQNTSNTQLNTFQKNQPIPFSTYSQYRQTLIDAENAQIHGVATTTFFFNAGVAKPYKSCPSIGYPVASTSQLTNPLQIAYNGSGSGAGYGVIGQLEPNGTFTGASAGTYVVCINPAGVKYIVYGEPNAHAEGGPAHWDDAAGTIVDDGAPTVIATVK